MSETLACRLATMAVALLVLPAACIPASAASLPGAKHVRQTPTFVDGRPVPAAEIRLENDPRYKGPKWALLGAQSRVLPQAPSQASAARLGMPGATPYQRRIAPILQSMRAKAAAQWPSRGSRPAASASAASSAAGLASSFPGFQTVPSVPGGMANDLNVIYSSIEMDVNQDGKPDIVDVQSDGAINVLLNPGTGNFSDFKVTSTNTAAINTGVVYIYAQSADVNGDGYPDLIVMDDINDAAFVYVNKKDGTFADPFECDFTFSTGAFFNQNGGSILAFDTNGDKIADLVAVTIYQGYDASGNALTTLSIDVALGKGDGTFATPTEQDTVIQGVQSVQQEYGDVVAGDMNKDGRIDLVIPFGTFDNNFNQLTVIAVGINNGDGTFSGLPTKIPTTGVAHTAVYAAVGSAAIADVNGDGNPDVIFGPGVPGVYLALGNGDGTVQNPTQVLVQPGTARSGSGGPINFADVNGDGNIDVISYNLGFVAVYLGQGKGVFNPSPIVQLVSGSAPSQQPAPADYTGDGKVDIAAIDIFSQTLGLFVGNNTTFAGPAAVAPSGQPAQDFQVQAVGDFNGDGYPDVVAQVFFGGDGFSYNLVLGLNDGKGNFTYTPLFASSDLSTAGASSLEPFAADFNGDGKLDLLFDESPYDAAPSGPYIAYNKGDGTFAAPVPIPLGAKTSCFLSSLEVGDVNGDGKPDIIATYDGDTTCYSSSPGNIPSSFFVFLNAGNGKFTSANYPFGYELYQTKLADLNGDGHLDLLLSDADDNVGLYYLYDIPGNGDGTFNFSGAQTLLENAFVTAIIPGDFDGDGKQDLAVGVLSQVDGNDSPIYDTTGVYLMKGNGDMTFQLPTQYLSGTYPVSGQFADFNGDGRPDLALAELSFDYYTDIQDGNFVSLINLGGGAFAEAPIEFTANAQLGQLFVDDFNGDGALDAYASITSADPSSGYNRGFLTESFLNTGGVTATLASSAATLAQSTPVTLTVTLTSVMNQTAPTGTMTFYDNGAVLSIVPVTSNTVTLSSSSLPVGANVIYASYSGDANFNTVAATNSVSVAVTALAPAFTLSSAAPATASLIQGQTATVSVGIATNATFTGSIVFTCSGAPTETSCTVNPGTVTLGGNQTSTVTAVIATTGPNNRSQAQNQAPTWMKTSGGIAFAAIFVFLPLWKRKRSATWLVLMLLALGATSTIVGCSSSNKYPGTPVGTSTVTITATSGSQTQSTTVALTITNK